MFLGGAALVEAAGAEAQVPLDRADPTVIQRIVPGNRTTPASPLPTPSATPAEAPAPAAAAPVTGIVRAITVTGAEPLRPEIFATAIADHVGRALDRPALTRLAGSVAETARAAGYPFATASIGAQTLENGILRVAVDLGRIDATRVVGARNEMADRILTRALATGRPVRRTDLERALLLVADLPGVRVKDSRFTRQDGFGILLVTIEEDRAFAYAQLDNRGSEEVGPARSTLIASLRHLAGAGDELALIASNTPFQPQEFAFLRTRYAAPLTASGLSASASASIARSEPGGALRPLGVVGRSADAAASLHYALLRRRTASLTATAEFRALGTNQMIAGRTIRRDRLTVLNGILDGTAATMGGLARGQLAVSAGLPLAGTTREGAPMGSRLDGDARFVTVSYALDWSGKVGGPFSVALASAGQLATRPLLATAEVGAGGPAFGRGYDFAERTGDKGIMGSAELRWDLGAIPGSLVSRAQLYGFADAATVGNLRGGIGGGSLFSAGGGVRLGMGAFDWLVEVAQPINADRFDTGDRSPRVTLRLSRVF